MPAPEDEGPTPAQTSTMNADGVDMESPPIDGAMDSASRIVHERASTEPTFTGLWLDTPDLRGAVAALQAQVPSKIRLRGHRGSRGHTAGWTSRRFRN